MRADASNVASQDACPAHASVTPWGTAGLLVLAGLVFAAIALRTYHLAAEGFADDEVHKWLAACRYMHGDFGGDDVEHPMLMKWLIALAIRVMPRATAPETLTRLPNAIAGGLIVWAVAQCGRRMFDRATGLVAAGLCAVSATAVGYGRIAKEDTLLTLFWVLMVWCLVEAQTAQDDGRVTVRARWEVAAAAAFGLMMASKYYPFLVLFPVLAQRALRTESSPWNVPLRRWLQLALIAAGTWVVFDWIALCPSTLRYLVHYVRGDHVGDRASSESLIFMGRLYNNLAMHYRGGTPPWFHVVFACTKFTSLTVLCGIAGMATVLMRQSPPRQRLVLLWIGYFLVVFAIFNAKYGRYFLPILPAWMLLAAHGALALGRRLRGPRGAMLLGTVVVLAEFAIAVVHAPHDRLYLNAIAGGDERLEYFFPHCDFFDAGLREAVADIAARAEPGAEVSSEAGWVVRYYADRADRHDLVDTSLVPSAGCVSGRTCYAVLQPGREYTHNTAAFQTLAQRPPWSVVTVAGHVAARVYRLEAGETPWPEVRSGVGGP